VSTFSGNARTELIIFEVYSGFVLKAVELDNVNNGDTHIAILFSVERWNVIKVYSLTVAIAICA
jgi:hypothetical protein